VVGTWTLTDPQGKLLLSGAWSAAKSSTRWTGAWRAVVSGRPGEYSGTWSSSVDLQGSTGFVELFEVAAQSVARGTWRSGNNSGAWAIRAAELAGSS
jgi:hypothetical protein